MMMIIIIALLLSAMLQYVVNAINSTHSYWCGCGSPWGPTTCILTCFPHKAYKYVYVSESEKSLHLLVPPTLIHPGKTAKLILCLKK